jgi:uncharacterized linocin/CFP29 family protein
MLRGTRADQIRVAEAGEWAFMSNEERRAWRANSRLFDTEFEVIDDVAVAVAEERLAGIADLRDAGFVQQRPLWAKISTYRKVSDMSPAEQSMTGKPTGESDNTERDEASVPVPITFKDFSIDRRDLEAARAAGATIETDDVSAATRQVVEALEDNLFNGGGPVVSGSQIAGYTNFADRNTYNPGAGTAWDGLADLTTILDHVLAMMQKAEDVDQGGGPWWLYVPSTYVNTLQNDYNSTAGTSVFERLMQIPGLQKIRFSGKLADKNVILVRAAREVADLVVEQDIDVIDVQDQIQFEVNMKVWAAMAPRLKSDYNGNSGIVHATLQ